jgi:hypothetical protein
MSSSREVVSGSRAMMGSSRAGAGAGMLCCRLLAHTGRMLAAEQLLLALQQRLELDVRGRG